MNAGTMLLPGLVLRAGLLTAALLLSCPASATRDAHWQTRPGDGTQHTRLRSQPLDISRLGAEASRQLFVTEDRRYEFALQMRFGDGGKQDAAPLQRLTGNSHDKQLAMSEIAIPLRLKISIPEPAGERIIVDTFLDRQLLDGVHGNSLWTRIGRVDLPPGFYRLSVQSGRNIPELAGVTASLEASWTTSPDVKTQGSADMRSLLARLRSADLPNQLAQLERLAPGAADTRFLRAESLVLPDAPGVLDPCSHRMHLHHESGNFWIVRRCIGRSAEIFHGMQPGIPPVPSSAQVMAFKRS